MSPAFNTLDKRFVPDPSVGRHGYPTPGPQSPTGNIVMDDVFFLTDTQWQQAADKHYDFVVIGTSFCALSFANKMLMDKPKAKILLLERGPFFLPSHFQTLPRAFAETLGGKSETFPWTVDRRTEMGQDGLVTCVHGSVPFFGGRSTAWSTWCPRPTPQEMEGWPQEAIDAADRHFDFAENLLRVQAADKIDHGMCPSMTKEVQRWRPVYGSLQVAVQTLLTDAAPDLKDFGIDRIEAARLASADAAYGGVDFLKYAVPGSLLELKQANPANLDIKLDCVVRKILNQDGYATALDTSCGVLPLNNAQLVLAMGALPPTTLVRNSFRGLRDAAGAQFAAHFITSVVARVPRSSIMKPDDDARQVGACYISGVASNDYSRQFHIQLSIIADQQPNNDASILMRYMPDVVATASPEQLATSTDCVVLVCAVLGELDVSNADSGFTYNRSDDDITTNSLLRIYSKSKADVDTWSTMDKATFAVLEQIGKKGGIEYWHAYKEPENGKTGEWRAERPPWQQTHINEMVHESSTLPIGDTSAENSRALVDLDYKLKDTKNVYVTGAGLWPRGGSWNPTLTMVALAADLAEKLTK